MTDARIIVVLEGGIVQTVVTHDPVMLGLKVVVIDYDTESTDEDELTEVSQEDGSLADAYVTSLRVQQATIALVNLDAEEI